MKKRSIIFIVCIILMNSLSGCKIRDKEYLMVCEKNEESAKKKLVDFFNKLDKRIKVEIELKEVYFDGNNYIGMEN